MRNQGRQIGQLRQMKEEGTTGRSAHPRGRHRGDRRQERPRRQRPRHLGRPPCAGAGSGMGEGGASEEGAGETLRSNGLGACEGGQRWTGHSWGSRGGPLGTFPWWQRNVWVGGAGDGTNDKVMGATRQKMMAGKGEAAAGGRGWQGPGGFEFVSCARRPGCNNAW